MAHLIILLDGWDWIQLSNVHKLVLKHGAANVSVSTLLPVNLAPALGALVNNDKIHVVDMAAQIPLSPMPAPPRTGWLT